jgi:toxin ParE1/3/4
MSQVRFSRQARQDLLDIWLWIASHDIGTADDILDRLEQGAARLARHPKLGPARPDIDASARALVVERWLILYRLIESGVQVVRVVDGARDIRRLAWPRSPEPSAEND